MSQEKTNREEPEDFNQSNAKNSNAKPADEKGEQGAEKAAKTSATDKQQQPATPKKSSAKGAKKGGKTGRKKKLKNPDNNAPDNADQDAVEEEKAKRPPQIHSDEEIRGMLASLKADYPEMSYKNIVKLALRQWCDQTAYLPPVQLRRLKGETLRTMGGYAAEAEKSAERITRKIIKAKMNPDDTDKLTDEMQAEVTGFREMRRTMMRQAAIPMVPDLPEAVGVGIAVLENEKLENEKLEYPDESRQYDCDLCIQILRAYRPPEYDLPDDLQDHLAKEDLE